MKRLTEYIDSGTVIADMPDAKAVSLHDIYRVIAGNSYYHGDRILAALTCIVEGKEVNPVLPADVAPVVHGQWKTNSDRPDTLICSICKCGFDMWKHDPHNYCPNCGARMDGDDNG